MNIQRGPFSWMTAILMLIAIETGCGGPKYQVAEVDGVLVVKGQPGAKVHIEFVPDSETNGPRSAADTGPQGEFTLHLMSRDGTSTLGAVVGVHKVTLSDIRLSESPDGRGIPIRFTSDYTLPGTTPLKQEVKAGKQSIRLQIP